MRRSIALVTGTTSGLRARLCGIQHARCRGYSQVIVSGRSLARVQKTATQLEAETKSQVFTPLELDLDNSSSVDSALAEVVKLGSPIDFLLLNAGNEALGRTQEIAKAAVFMSFDATFTSRHELPARRGRRHDHALSPRLPDDGTWLQQSQLVARRWAPFRQETT